MIKRRKINSDKKKKISNDKKLVAIKERYN